MSCSCQGPKFSSHHPHWGSSQLTGIPARGLEPPPLAFVTNCTSVNIRPHRCKYIHITNKNSSLKKNERAEPILESVEPCPAGTQGRGGGLSQQPESENQTKSLIHFKLKYNVIAAILEIKTFICEQVFIASKGQSPSSKCKI